MNTTSNLHVPAAKTIKSIHTIPRAIFDEEITLHWITIILYQNYVRNILLIGVCHT